MVAAGLYELVAEWHEASPERKEEIEAEKQRRFPQAPGMPQYPTMVYMRMGNTAYWGFAQSGMEIMDNDGVWGGGASFPIADLRRE
jgi:hypothetical protein